MGGAMLDIALSMINHGFCPRQRSRIRSRQYADATAGTSGAVVLPKPLFGMDAAPIGRWCRINGTARKRTIKGAKMETTARPSDHETHEQRAERIAAAVRRAPAKMTLQMAQELGVPECEIIRALPDGRAMELDIGRWEEIFQGFADLGDMHVIVSNGAATIEAVGEFGGFSTWNDFFNVQTKTLDMHIRHGQLGAVFAVEKPSHMNGMKTYSIQFFDKGGAAALKVFFNFGDKAAPQRETRFQEMRERFRVAK
jgi:putative hemin transport protein